MKKLHSHLSCMSNRGKTKAPIRLNISFILNTWKSLTRQPATVTRLIIASMRVFPPGHITTMSDWRVSWNFAKKNVVV